MSTLQCQIQVHPENIHRCLTSNVPSLSLHSCFQPHPEQTPPTVVAHLMTLRAIMILICWTIPNPLLPQVPHLSYPASPPLVTSCARERKKSTLDGFFSKQTIEQYRATMKLEAEEFNDLAEKKALVTQWDADKERGRKRSRADRHQRNTETRNKRRE